MPRLSRTLVDQVHEAVHQASMTSDILDVTAIAEKIRLSNLGANVAREDLVEEGFRWASLLGLPIVLQSVGESFVDDQRLPDFSTAIDLRMAGARG